MQTIRSVVMDPQIVANFLQMRGLCHEFLRLNTIQAESSDRMQVVLSLDADFLVSAGLHEKLSSPEASAALLEDVSIQRNVVVLPAFETETSLGLEKGGDIANLAQRCEVFKPVYNANFCFPLSRIQR